MEIFGFIFQIIFTNLIGNNIFYLARKLMGDKRSYKEIVNNEKDSGIRYSIGIFMILALIIVMKKCIK